MILGKQNYFIQQPFEFIPAGRGELKQKIFKLHNKAVRGSGRVWINDNNIRSTSVRVGIRIFGWTVTVPRERTGCPIIRITGARAHGPRACGRHDLFHNRRELAIGRPEAGRRADKGRTSRPTMAPHVVLNPL